MGKFTGEPKAKYFSELRTPKRLQAIRSICNARRVDAETECAACFGQPVKPEELSQKSASYLIGWLKQGDNHAAISN